LHYFNKLFKGFLKRLRELQNQVWARESLNQGIKLAQHKLYKEAIGIFPRFF